MGNKYNQTNEDASTLPPSDEEIDNYENYSYFGTKNNSITFKDVVMRAIEKCRQEGSKEMTKGGQKIVFSKDLNDWIPVNIPDQRKLYQQTIIQLYDLLLWYFDKTANKNIGQIENNIQGAYKKYFDNYIKAEYWEPYKEQAIQSGIIKTGNSSDVGIFYVQQFEEYVFNQYRKMFQELILLYKRKRELSNVRTIGLYDTLDDLSDEVDEGKEAAQVEVK